VERLGVEVSGSYVARAAVVLACGDDVEACARWDGTRGRTNAAIVALRTKSDLAAVSDADWRRRRRRRRARRDRRQRGTRGGLGQLVDLIQELIVGGDAVTDLDAPILTQERHPLRHRPRARGGRRLSRAMADGRRSGSGRGGSPARRGGGARRVDGAVDVEHVLDEVFRRFCVGK
jgi:tRNA U34 5-carboxymethylaminomethyl modifying GTPase MnmE/TrmE